MSRKGKSGRKYKINLISSVNHKGNHNEHLPAEANVKNKIIEKSQPNTFMQFVTDIALVKDKEFAYTVDKQGFVHNFIEGNQHSVGFSKGQLKKGLTVIHNHPNSSNFSGADLKSFATTNIDAIIAVGKNGKTYILKKGTQFNKKDFLDYIANAEGTATSKSAFVSKVLQDGQRRFHYKYEEVI